jgi:Flp pilus assembly protein TadG
MREKVRAGESGQSLVLIVIAGAVLIAMAALAIDIAQWYQTHHRAQVAADAAALAAATCMNNANTTATCTDNTDATHASSVATVYASTNGISLTDPSQVSVDTTAYKVTVTTQTPAPLSFAGIQFAHTITAVAVSSWNVANIPLSLFTGNQSCAAGTGLQLLSSGGGQGGVLSGMYSDGVINNRNNTNAGHYGGVQYYASGAAHCGPPATSYNTKNTTVSPGADIPYPEQFTEPTVSSTSCSLAVTSGCTWTTEPTSAPSVNAGTCTFAATYFASDASGINQINYPGIYCVVTASGSTTIATSYSGNSNNCNDGQNKNNLGSDDTAGSIFVGGTTAPSGQFEFVGPCVVDDGQSGGGLSTSQTQITGSACGGSPDAPNTCPLVYATNQANYPTACTTSGYPNTPEVVNSPDGIYLDGNTLTLNAPLYDPCGTGEISANVNTFGALLEAANISVDKNSFGSFKGTGPPVGGGGAALLQ